MFWKSGKFYSAEEAVKWLNSLQDQNEFVDNINFSNDLLTIICRVAIPPTRQN